MARARTKGKDDAPEVVCLVENGRLVPAYPHDAEVLASYSKGAKVFVSLRRQGKRRQHSIWYGLLGDMVKTGQTQWNSTKAADRACRMALDMIEPAKTVSGDWLSYDASLWDFTDEELDERIEMLRALFLKITGLDPDDVRREFGGGKFDDGYDPPANDAGNETLAGDAVPPLASEEGTSAAADVPPPLAGTGATESQADPAVAADVAGDDLREPVAAEQGQIIREGDAPLEASNGEASDSTHPDTELSAEERVWLKQGSRMMLASLPAPDPESLRVLIVQLRLIKDLAPKDVGNACLSRMEVIRLHCTGVCKGQNDLDLDLVARTALCSIEDITPDPVKVRDGK